MAFGTISVPSVGPKQCKLAIVGEAPTNSEVSVQQPFAGGSGTILNDNLHRVGLSRSLCYITNLSKVSVPGDDFKAAFWKGTKPNQYLLECKNELLKELDALDTNVIVALGEGPLWALTGNTQVGKWRGSILTCTMPSGRIVKVIGTYHTSAINRNFKFNPIQRFDLRKAIKESDFAERNLPKRDLLIAPTFEDVVRFFQQNHGRYAFDIETSPHSLNCISFAFNRHQALSIPTTKGYWGSWTNLKLVLRVIHKVLDRDCVKIGQNMSYDIQWIMRAWNMLPRNTALGDFDGPKIQWHDTMIAQHSCYSELPKGLDFLASIYTDELYYKDDLKMWLRGESDSNKYWTYNARDSAVTFEVAEKLDIEMLELGTRHTFDYMMELLEPIIFMNMSGLRIDHEKLKEHKDAYTKSLGEREKRFSDKFGGVNPHSAKQVQELAYGSKENGGLGLKPITKKGRRTCDKNALEKLSIKSPEIAEVIGIRGDRKLISTYMTDIVDPISQRFMFSINPTGAETYRLSSSSSVFGFGTNAQNWPKKIRDMVIPDEGMEFTEVDLKGAESMIVAYWSGDLASIKIFEEDKNIHTFTACLVFNVTPEDVKENKEKHADAGTDTKSYYFRAKKLRHTLEKKGSFIEIQKQLKIPAAEAKVLQRKFYDLNPNLEKLFRHIDSLLRTTKVITTATGRRRIFFGRLGPDLVKEAVAYEPQEVVGCVINHGIIRFYYEVCKKYKDISVKLQVHDSLLVQHRPDQRKFVVEKLIELMIYKLTYHGRTFHIPVELQNGMNWRDMK